MQKRVLLFFALLGLLTSYVIPTAAQEVTAPRKNFAAKSTATKNKHLTKSASSDATSKSDKLEKIVKTDVEWRKQLSRMQFNVTRKHATERARTGKYWDHKGKGTYKCVCCDLPLFSSKTKFRSGTGWPSFYAPVKKEYIGRMVDRKLSSARMEVHCERCEAHLGHVFSDGPRPTGLRYCINSASLKFESFQAAKRKAAADAKAKEAAKGEAKTKVETPVVEETTAGN